MAWSRIYSQIGTNNLIYTITFMLTMLFWDQILFRERFWVYIDIPHESPYLYPEAAEDVEGDFFFCSNIKRPKFHQTTRCSFEFRTSNGDVVMSCRGFITLRLPRGWILRIFWWICMFPTYTILIRQWRMVTCVSIYTYVVQEVFHW